MRCPRLLILLCFCCFIMQISAQQRKIMPRSARNLPTSVAKSAHDVQALLEQYEWQKAVSAVQALLHGAKDATSKDSLQTLQRNAQRAEEMMASTQRIVVIDSVVVSKKSLLSALKLSDEAGRLLPTAQVFPQRSQFSLWSQATFVNPLNTTAIFAAPSQGKQRLQSVFRAGSSWTSPMALAGIDSLFVNPDFPFLLSDGTTLYFSAKGQETIGGYDLFVTRYNPETRQYVKPTNLGMPFNSPNNEYFYVVDPTTGIGVFATDRRQPDGKVCLYSFLVPNEREDYDSEHMPLPQLRAAAQLLSISATQQGKAVTIKSALQRKAQLNATKTTASAANFRFVINDNVVYRSIEDFKNQQARQLAPQWLNEWQRKKQLEEQVNAAELAYARQQTNDLRQSLQQLRNQLEEVSREEAQLAQQLRQLESAQ